MVVCAFADIRENGVMLQLAINQVLIKGTLSISLLLTSTSRE